MLDRSIWLKFRNAFLVVKNNPNNTLSLKKHNLLSILTSFKKVLNLHCHRHEVVFMSTASF